MKAYFQYVATRRLFRSNVGNHTYLAKRVFSDESEKFELVKEFLVKVHRIDNSKRNPVIRE